MLLQGFLKVDKCIYQTCYMYFSPLAKQNQAEVGPKSCIMWFWIVGIVNVVVAWIYKSCYMNILLFAKRNKTEDFEAPWLA